MSAPDHTINDMVDLDLAMLRVSFERSCLDMGWQWEAREASHLDPTAPTAGETVRAGWLIRCSFQRPERDTGEVGRGFGRWWYVERGTTVSGAVKTMFAAAKMIVEHELLEAFKFDGQRPFDPHHTVQELTAGEPMTAPSDLSRPFEDTAIVWTQLGPGVWRATFNHVAIGGYAVHNATVVASEVVPCPPRIGRVWFGNAKRCDPLEVDNAPPMTEAGARAWVEATFREWVRLAAATASDATNLASEVEQLQRELDAERSKVRAIGEHMRDIRSLVKGEINEHAVRRIMAEVAL